jgi:hypothetical protein
MPAKAAALGGNRSGTTEAKRFRLGQSGRSVFLFYRQKEIAIMLTLDKIYHASYALKDVIRTTDLIHAPNICPGSSV